MKTKHAGTAALIGALTTSPLIALLFLAQRLIGFSFPPFELFEVLTKVLPGPLVTWGIDAMIDTLRFLGISVAETAKTAEQIMALGIFLIIGTAGGLISIWIFQRLGVKSILLSGIILGSFWGTPLIAISYLTGGAEVLPAFNILWLDFLFLVWGVSIAWIVHQLQIGQQTEEPKGPLGHGPGRIEKLNRRQFLITLGASSATITVLGAGLGALLKKKEPSPETTGDIEGGLVTSKLPDPRPLPNQEDLIQPVPGTRAEYTPIENHYKVFIGLEPEDIDTSVWRLPVTGLVDNPLQLTLRDLQSDYPSISQYVTLSCISGRIPTTLISTTHWTGVSVQDVLDDAQVQEGAEYLYITSADGFYETVPLDLIYADPRIMFCYAWDGAPLPKEHGYPLRIWIPDRFGMKQPKWITGVEVMEEYKEGYWVERDWDRIARIKTRSVIDTVAVEEIIQEDGDRYIPIGGIAFAGARGISKVEARVDDGPWKEAQRRSPLSETTWVIWRYDWPFQEGEHTFQVRCYDGKGVLQVTETSSPRPDGATGIHSVKRTI
jgi:DMSO/TMAO reductase YedYZ molybdopterin-dependent catalytic subunit